MKSITFVLCSLIWLGVANAASLPVGVTDMHSSATAGVCQKLSDIDTAFLPIGEYKLEKNVTLYLVPCMDGAYQPSYRAYSQWADPNTKEQPKVSQLVVLAYDDTQRSVVGALDLISPKFDPKTNYLNTRSKGRDMGDCGQSSVSKIIVGDYGAVTAKTFKIKSKANCDGANNDWPVVFSQ
jgi:hypothetical protein